MTTNFQGTRRFTALLATGLLAFAAAASQAATITIVNADGAGEGFNDPTVVAPVGGNPGTTLGAQRLFVFQAAANIWGATLPSAVLIQVNSQFNPLTCTATSGVLGSTGANTVHRDFAGAPYPGTWYVQSLANRLAGTDLSAQVDMTAQFNSTLDAGAASCLGGEKWYYGLDGLEGVNVELLPVVLHELGHGLGFMTTTSGSTGATQSTFPSIYDRFLLDRATNLHWYQETAAQRVTSAIATNQLVWDGPITDFSAASFLAKQPSVLVSAPPSLAGAYAGNAAAFGGAITLGGVTGDVVLMQDGVAPAGDGCEALLNGPALAGKIALVDRGVCAFVAKAESAQAHGAIGLIIANNAAGVIIPGGTDPAITIPVISITQAQGNAFKTALLSNTVTATIGLNAAQLAGADNLGRPLMYTPTTFASGSSVSHFDVSLTPNALMEPNINLDLHNNLDLTPSLMADIGWMDQATATTLAMFTVDDLANGLQLTWQFADASGIGAITVERSTTEVGPWSPVPVSTETVEGRTVAVDATVSAGVTYFYRLSVMDRSGQVANYGLASAKHSAAVVGHSAVLMAPSPNPAAHGSVLSFRLSQPEFVRLTIVDATGRTVRSLQNAMMAPGTHSQVWDGRSDGGQNVASGLYFAVMQTAAGRSAQRLVVVR